MSRSGRGESFAGRGNQKYKTSDAGIPPLPFVHRNCKKEGQARVFKRKGEGGPWMVMHLGGWGRMKSFDAGPCRPW